MTVVEIIQHLSLSDNELQNAKLQNTPNLTGPGLTGKIGIDSLGAIVYIAGYSGSNPIINRLKELIVQPSEPGETPLLKITKDVQGHKDAISINLEALLTRLLRDEEIINQATWSSTRIVEYVNATLGATNPLPIQDEDLTVAMTSAQLNTKYQMPDFGINTTVYSESLGIQYKRISETLWRFEEIEIV